MVPCPRCGEPLDLDQGWCVPCREKSRSWLRYLLRTGVLTVAVAAGLLFWQRQAAEAWWTGFITEVELARNPHWKSAPQPPPSITPVATAQVSPSTFVYIAGLSDPPVPGGALPGTFFPPPQASTAPAGLASPPPEPAPAGVDVRRFYGVVYDALSLKAVSGARLTFKMTGDRAGWTAMTDDRGHYQVDLFTSTIEKMSVSVEAPPGFREGLFEDRDPPLRERALSARRRIAEEMTPDELEPVRLRVHGDPRVVALDLVLLPEASKR